MAASAHLLRDEAEPTAVADPGWLALSAALTDQVPRLAGRQDVLVRIAPGAGHGYPACFLPAHATIEVDGCLLPDGLDPRTLRPARPGDRERYPVAWGALVHETAHARHTRWAPPVDAAPATALAAVLLEESRIEVAHLARRPGDRRWLRATIGNLLLEEPFPEEATRWTAAHAAALVLGRVDAGVLDAEEAEPVTRLATRSLGDALLDELASVWRAAHRAADDDYARMLELGRRWCELLEFDPDGPDPDALPSPPTHTDHATAGHGRTPSGPVAAAVAAAVRAVAATEAAEQAEQDAVREAGTRRAAERASEADAHQHARATAERVFASGSTRNSRRARAGWTQREPTPAERSAAGQLARRLRAAAHRERVTTRSRAPVPPGRLRVREALTADAQRAAGLRPTAEPWVRTAARRVPCPPLQVGIAVDVSGSMGAFTRPLSSVAWIVAQAVAWTQGTSATVAFGERVTPVTRPGEAPAKVRKFAARDGTEESTNPSPQGWPSW